MLKGGGARVIKFLRKLFNVPKDAPKKCIPMSILTLAALKCVAKRQE